MELTDLLFSVISNCVVIPASILCLAPMCHQFGCSTKALVLRMTVIFIVLIGADSFIQCYFKLNPNIVMIPMLIIMFLAYHFSLKVHISKSLSIFVYVCAVMSTFGNTANAIDALFNPNAGAIAVTPQNAVIRFCLCSAAAALMFFPMRRFGSTLVDNLDNNRIWYITVLITSIVLYVNVSMAPLKYETLYTNNVFRIFWLLQAMFLTMLLLLAVIFYFIVNNFLGAARNEERARFLEMQENSYIKQQRYIEETARARHDFKQTVRTLHSMAMDNDIEGIRYYLDKYTETLPENDVRHYCINSAVNALLNHYAWAAVNNEISTNWEVDLPEKTGISDTDLCVTVGNILDNAVTACRGITEGDRYIKLTIKVHNASNLYIIAVNSFNGNIKFKNDRYYSTNRKGSGIGLSSVTSIAEQNGGTAHFHHEGNEFFSEVMMKVSGKKTDQK